ncbi:uncharacterized protein TRAVEDRAFT_30419 [Trametes versicolor FP-101664 SS1]|uniref:uncharacterized protein n=1 Tax=Trametes versicolor (strain FP-101664) TaxID=717944 RepID=UPI00046241C8|nr:uncharacterized protein TRAVEDRAFT_30419 [Trametes versicolor FP-101664 SS1]EIW55657.1 hypothetical protein TRAVEDRAFT_30419 [Trametes versicolor FP-101664 SS1]
MSTTATIRFPPPPPTRNELTSEQRAKLIRTNNKLGQVLGSTPHVLDLTYRVPLQRPREAEPPRPKTPTSMKNPFRTHTRSKSSPKVDMDALRAISPDSISSSSSGSSRRSSSSVRSIADNEQSWRSPYPARRPPLLRLSTPTSSRKPTLETIPGSPPSDEIAFTISDAPSFSIPSDAAVRREKMRRLRRRLGENVPTDLVFPSSPEESDSEEDSPLLSTPTSTASREWLLVHKPLPDEPYVTSTFERALPELERPLPKVPTAMESLRARHRLFKERPKDKPSKGAQRLESIAENSKDAVTGDHIICVGVTASAGMHGKGKSRRFVQGEVSLDQIGGAWGGFGIGW